MPYGFISGLIYMVDQLSPDYIIVAWDAGSDYRREIYPLYKEKRRALRRAQDEENKKLAEIQKQNPDPNYKPPHDIRREINETIEMVKLLGIPQFRTNGEEADDHRNPLEETTLQIQNRNRLKRS
jgi:5'-3' exonuclease